jgi:phospholipid/cholesterol/gamma-HCH transport system substrate-binding protein
MAEIKAGVFVLLGLLVFGVFLAIIQGYRPTVETKTYHASFKDIAGLNPGADVRFGGTKIGRVTEIALHPTDPSLIRVSFQVPERLPVHQDSKVYVTQTTLTSEMHLEITTGTAEAGLMPSGTEIETTVGGLGKLLAGADDTSQTLQEVLADFRDLMGVEEAKKAAEESEEDMATVADVIDEVEGVVSEGRENVKEILDKAAEIEDSAKQLLEDTREILAENRPQLKSSIENVRETTETAKAAVGDARDILERFAALSERFDGIANSLENALGNVEGLSEDAREIIAENRLDIQDTIRDLRKTASYLREFARTVSEQPESLLRGETREGRRHQ